MVYISTFNCIKSLIPTHGEGVGEKTTQTIFCLGLVLFSCLMFRREPFVIRIFTKVELLILKEKSRLRLRTFALPPIPLAPSIFLISGGQ